MVTPGATAWLLTDRFPRLLAIAVAIGSLTSFFGAWLSYYLDGATGGIIVVAQTLLFLITFIFAPKPRPAGQPPPRQGGRMLNLFLAPFQFPFMVNAIAISIVVAIPCALLSVFLVLKGWALMGDAMSHAVFPGRGAGLHYRHPLRHRRVYRRSAVRRDDRFSRR
ncbi:manganese ABC transporter [Klebsiella pneumoniae]|uniref:Manganese ABC transporter n=1 Tax=Klebsiella pneumoniae TaxID=573 RepID=A0A378FP93_KLEPN|nr:manganese ABC transporter [Klebsiella pneumoniae]